MTFEKFEELFKSKYPNSAVFMHGKFAGTQRSKTVTVYFDKDSCKSYDYYGAYEDILCKNGIKVISTSRLHEAELELKHYKEQHGKNYHLFTNVPADFSKEIAELEAFLAKVNAEYIIV